MKFCTACQAEKPESEFHKQKRNQESGLQPVCKVCRKAWRRTYKSEHPELVKAANDRYYRSQPAKHLLRAAKRRAATKCVPCSILLSDILAVWPADNRCPILGIEFAAGVGHPLPSSASLDAFDPKLGYIPGNIHVISFQANAVKNDVTDPTILERVAAWIRYTKPES